MPNPDRSRVLCVDDDEDACEILGLLLNSCEIDATCVQSALAAWPLIKGRTFDLYLLDGWLPGVDGFDFCRQIREFDSETPILFYSGAAYDADKQRGMAAGANAYVTKPDVEGVIAAIQDLIATANATKHAVGVTANDKPLPFAENWFGGFFGGETASD